ncbi:hypothetical protein M8C13_18255 [Crossiella sp. SN42]|uniref:hypothetical protein n=1 Tax=Crossiella sp. SN42 TaxID=2944808 RepID=UPI00207CD197|nr:hypothetical protein [Crossiella sp. SN42]MCO1577701.1 hypothetical protein [Crossiella sp. SN42]
MTVEPHPAENRLYTTWVTSRVEAVDHAVTDEDMAAGIADGKGIYRAVCGARVVAALLEEPPHTRCLRCQTYVWARATLRDMDLDNPGPRRSRPGLLALLGWLRG